MADHNTGNSSAHLSPDDYEETMSPLPEDTASPYSYSDMPQADNTSSAPVQDSYELNLPNTPETGIPVSSGDTTRTGTVQAGAMQADAMQAGMAQNLTSDNDYGLTLPVASEGGIPAYPGTGVWSPAAITFPVFPSCPGCSPCTDCNSSQNYAQVRFLNASTNAFPVNVSIDNTNYAANARFGTVSNYGQLSDGFHTVTVRRASGLRTILLQQTFPFTGGQKYTLVLVDTASGGLAMSQVSDVGCRNMNYNTGCYRVANMSYSGSSYDVMLYSHDAVFRNVDFREVTSYKQAMSGSYQFYITNANTFSVIRELPMIVIGTISPAGFGNSPLVSFQLDIAAGDRYTSYLIGNNWSDAGFQVLTVTD